MRLPLHGMLLLVLCAGLAVGRPAPAAEKVLSDRLLPANVLAYVTVPNVDEFKARWNESLFGELARDPALADFRRDIEVLLAAASREVEREAGVSLNDLLAIPSGEFSVALVQPPGRRLAGVAFLDFGDSEDTIDQLLQKATEAATDEGARRRIEEIENTRVVVYTFGDAPGEEEPVQQVAYFVRDSYLVAGSDLGILESVLARWDGTHDRTFAENEVYRYIKLRCRSRDAEPVLTWYLNPLDLVKAAMAAAGQEGAVGLMLGIVPGLNKFRAVGGSLDIATEDFDSVTRTMIYVDQPPAGVLNIFQFPATDLTPPGWVPASTSAFLSLNWDVAAAYTAVANLYDTLTFQGRGAFDRMVDEFVEDNELFGGLHPRKDLIDHLTGRIHVITDAPRADDDDDENFLIAMEVKDAAAVKAVIARIAGDESVPIQTREFRGETIYEMPNPGVFGEGTATNFGMGVAHGCLMLTGDVTLLERALRSDAEPPLAELPEYRRIAGHFPEKTSMLSFQRQDTQVKTFYEMLRSRQLGQELEEVDFGKLPPFEALEKYLTASGGYAVPDRRGALMVSFSLRTKESP